jgi:hypothetical protein
MLKCSEKYGTTNENLMLLEDSDSGHDEQRDLVPNLTLTVCHDVPIPY